MLILLLIGKKWSSRLANDGAVLYPSIPFALRILPLAWVSAWR